jgi:hypothetical protein
VFLILGLFWAYFFGGQWAYSGLIFLAGKPYSGLILGLFLKKKIHRPLREAYICSKRPRRGDPCLIGQVFSALDSKHPKVEKKP